MTPFRKSQARAVLEGTVRWLAADMQRLDALHEVVRELAADGQLWAELELARPDSSPTPTPSNRSATGEHECRSTPSSPTS